MNVTIAQRVKEVHAAPSQGSILTIVPICGKSGDQPAYKRLEPSILQSVTVTEVTAAGSVPELRVTNTMDERLLLIDGQELRGAKQNRITNTDILVPAKSEVIIPVSCVEHGRWHPVSDTFSPGKSAGYRTRSAKPERVHASLRESGRHDADQQAVWDEVHCSVAASGVSSPTGALADAYQKREAELIAFRQSLAMPEDAVGLAVFRDDRFLGLDLFDRHTTLKYFWESLVDSYFVDLEATVAPVMGTGAAAPLDSKVRQILDEAANQTWESFAVPGEGRDWRLAGSHFVGSALVWEDRSVLHFQLFPRQASSRPRLHRSYLQRDDLPPVY